MVSFNLCLSKNDWSQSVSAWNCSALGLPGVKVVRVIADGDLQAIEHFLVNPGLRELRYIGPGNRPSELVVTLELAGSIIQMERAGIIAAVVAAIASILVAVIQYAAATAPARSRVAALSQEVNTLGAQRDAADAQYLAAKADNAKLAAKLDGLMRSASPALAGSRPVTFTAPAPNAPIHSGEGFKVKGRLARVQPGRFYWLVDTRTDDHALGWPREEPLKIAPDGSFSHDTWDHGAPGKVFVCVMAVDPATHRKIVRWHQDGKRLQDWPPIPLKHGGFDEVGCTPIVLLEKKTE